jgi:hypothetical protein
MPNGHDEGFVKLCAAIDGFRLRYGRWPTRVRIPIWVFNDLLSLFTARDFLTLSSRVRLVLADCPIVAEDDDGGTYSYSLDGFSEKPPKVGAYEWFGVHPRPELDEPIVTPG